MEAAKVTAAHRRTGSTDKWKKRCWLLRRPLRGTGAEQRQLVNAGDFGRAYKFSPFPQATDTGSVFLPLLLRLQTPLHLRSLSEAMRRSPSTAGPLSGRTSRRSARTSRTGSSASIPPEEPSLTGTLSAEAELLLVPFFFSCADRDMKAFAIWRALSSAAGAGAANAPAAARPRSQQQHHYWWRLNCFAPPHARLPPRAAALSPFRLLAAGAVSSPTSSPSTPTRAS